MIQRIIVIFIFGFLVLSCGSSRKRSAKKYPPREAVVMPTNDKTKSTESTELPKINGKTKSPVITNTSHYIEVYKNIAMKEMQDYGIPASITLAQGILESGSGKGRLAVQANNHFGIKCHGWNGGKIYHDDDRSQECFRKYRSAETSFKDHSEFLTNRSRYAKLFTLRKSDYKGWAKGLRKAGYATDKRYPQKLISIIETYDLDDYDRMVLKNKYVPAASPQPEQQSTRSVNSKTHIVIEGDTLYSISRRYGISVESIQNLNNLRDNTINIGQVLKLKSN